MDVQPIIAAHRRGVHRPVLSAYRRPGLSRARDPELVFVVAMCAYATGIARGLLPGSFNAADACRYARGFLIPEELLERPELDVDRAAAGLGVPADELRAARADHGPMARWP
jgi:hypothetical protein